MRRPIIAGNWKMHKTARQAAELVEELKPLLAEAAAEVVLCPPFTALAVVGAALAGTGIALGAQNMHWEREGAYTGEVSAAMLLDAGCRFVILGHSERRQFFGETDETVNRKVRAALAAGLTPIACVGETLAEREAGQTGAVVERQVRAVLADLQPEQVAGMVVAYEPVWAIGTGRNATAEDAQAVCALIRRLAGEAAGEEAANSLRIQYGGSVKPENIAGFMACPDIDGALVGGASLTAATFADIIRYDRP